MIKVSDLNERLTISDYLNVLESFSVFPFKETEEYIIFPSACHHVDFMNHKKKLYLYKDTKMFHCYSCSTSFSLYDLIIKIMKNNGTYFSFPDSINYVCEICEIDKKGEHKPEIKKSICNWQSCIAKYKKNEGKFVDNKIYDKGIIDCFEDKFTLEWIEDNIEIDTMKKFNIKWYNTKQQVVIPVYNQENDLIGIHARNMNPDLIEYGLKYQPLKMLNGMEYKFPTSIALYGINVNQNNIRYKKEVLLFEAPKSVLQLESILDINNSVAMFGMNFSKYRRDILLKLEIEDVVICLDKQYETKYNYKGEFTNEYLIWKDKISRIASLFKGYCNIYYIEDDGRLGYKASPSDYGKDVWENLYERRIKFE